MPRPYTNQIFRVIVLLLGLWLGFDLVSHLVAEVFWFQEVGYLPAFLLQLKTQVGLWAIALVVICFLLGNLALAQRLSHPKPQATDVGLTSELALPGSTKLSVLLPVGLGLSLLAGLMLLYYIHLAAGFWHPTDSPELRLNTEYSFLQKILNPPFWQDLAIKQPALKWQMGLVVGLAIALLIYPQFLLNAIALLISLCFGLVLSGHWTRILLYFHPTSFNSTDPLFQQDISFYVFKLPVWELVEFSLTGLFLFGLVAVTLVYLLSGDSLSQGRFPGFSPSQQRHLYGMSSGLMLALALRYWLLRYELLYSINGVTFGASYTDVNVNLPVYTILTIISLAIAVFLGLAALLWSKTVGQIHEIVLRGLKLYLVVAATATLVLPEAVQRLVVQPNELAREKPYIQRSIAFTRQAFDLENIEVKTFDPRGGLSAANLQQNDLTIRNIRLWDTRPLLETNRQLQQIRPYYKFPDADIDRYTLKKDVGTEKQQVLIAARELDYTSVPQEAQTWENKHLVYTHGYGFTLSPVNTVAPGGLPDYFVKDIATNAGTGNSALGTSSELIRASIPIGKPRIYYGELSDTYVMTSTSVREFDYPSGNENVYNNYDGTGGVAIGSWWQRCLFAQYLKDWQMLFTRNFTPQTKLLFRRDIKERVRAIAPFLRFDSNPYLVAAGAFPNRQSNYLYWIIDAYTTSAHYPYSDLGKDEFNYIRNSVKVVIDAYNGSVVFYVADTQDPIINTWSAIFPGLFKPLSALPATLRSHIRYPVDFFNVQSERLLTYHMTDPQVFYNREDQWQVPKEIYGSKQQPVEPYYLIVKLPTATAEEFILLLPFTPTQRTNLIAWLAARSDGEEYGKLLLYLFPKQQLVYGTEQIEALINQDPVISQQISLWNREGSRAIQGNLLVIPIQQSLLYVEPLYLEAEQNSLPTLVRVVVAYNNRIVMAESLEQALKAVFQPEKPAAPAIIRPVE